VNALSYTVFTIQLGKLKYKAIIKSLAIFIIFFFFFFFFFFETKPFQGGGNKDTPPSPRCYILFCAIVTKYNTYTARAKRKGKNYHIGTFKNFQEAYEARKKFLEDFKYLP
jgi:hypothetical protein